MSRLERMGQSSVDTLLRWCVEHQPGVTTHRLFEYTREWYGKLWTQALTRDFERALWEMRKENYRCTNKQWYPAGHQEQPKPKGPPAVDPRQTRMFG